MSKTLSNQGMRHIELPQAPPIMEMFFAQCSHLVFYHIHSWTARICANSGGAVEK